MAEGAALRFSWDKLIPIACSIAGLAVVVGGALRVDGGRDQQLAENSRRIEKLEAADAIQGDRLRTIEDRAIRIETKLDIIVPAKGAAR